MKATGNFPHQQSVNFNSEWQSKQAVKFLEFFYKKKNRNLKSILSKFRQKNLQPEIPGNALTIN